MNEINEKIDFLVKKTKELYKVNTYIKNKEYYVSAPYTKLKVESKNKFFQPIAERLGMNSREVELLFIDIFSDPTDDEFDKIKEMLFISKLSRTNAIEQFNKEIFKTNFLNSENENNKVKMNEEIKELKAQVIEIENSLTEINEIFEVLVDELKEILDQYSYLYNDIPDDKKVLVDIFATSSKRVNIRTDVDMARKVVIVNWPIVRSLKSSHKIQIFMKYNKLKN